MLNLKINKSVSVFDKLELNEIIDLSILDKLINSNLLQITSWELNGFKFENEKQQLQLIKKHTKNNKLKVVYNKTKYVYGRVFPNKSLSLGCLHRAIRHTLTYNQYVDIDIANCHPEILKQICEANNIPIKFLKEYTDNREKILLETQEHYNCTRDEAKVLFIILAYYGSFDNWVKERNSINTEPTEFIKNYIKELKIIGIVITNENPELLKVIKSLNKKNEKASTVSIYLQEKERLILEVVYNHLIFKGLITNKDCVLCFDGLMILQSKYYSDLLEELSNIVYTTTGFKFKFTQKELNEHYLNELDNELDPDSFEYKSIEFEKTHCKIVNKSLYIKETSEDILFFSKRTLKEAYEHLKGDDRKLFIDQWTTGNENIRKYDSFDSYPFPLICPNNIFNLWTNFECEKYIDTYIPDNEGLQIILNHIKVLCGNDNNVYEYFIKWIGQMIQFPAIKSICPTLISKQGAGKGTLNKLIQKMLGKSKCLETTNPGRDVWGNFNSVMVNAFFINLNELSKRDTIEAEGKIKGLITDGSLTINQKGTNQFEINSYHRFLITTNKEDPIQTSEDDRRNLIIRSSDELIGNTEYFNILYHLLENNNTIRTCYDYFKNIPNLDKFNNLKMPQTEYQANLRLLDISPPEQFLIDYCSNSIEDKVELLGKEIYELFQIYITENNIEYNTTPLKFGVKIANLKINGIEKGRHTKKGETKYYETQKILKHFKINNDDPFIEEAIIPIIPIIKEVIKLKSVRKNKFMIDFE